ncbi:MAG: RsmB/NOP family class I SAM-dependent RNA methyltransferase [Flammeovirgaceae bacterium]|nr:RsmB/NOP family class I SAM-dependent RNA methyltransferase [Flammeovirgaceae bacterium]
MLPKDFTDRIQNQLSDAPVFLESLQGDSPVSLRLNPYKLINQFDECHKVPWCENGFYLEERPDFYKDPLIFNGSYYVQEASSMFLDTVLREAARLDEAPKVLDLCAAPGGKSTLISSFIGQNGMLVSNEIVGKRVNPLTENIQRWGNSNCLVSNNSPKDFEALKSFFDVAVVDAPCSGEGMFRKDKKAVKMWSDQLVRSCAIRQKQILESIEVTIKPGGHLIYSTCTFATDENEENLKWLAESGNFKSIRINLNPEWGIEEVAEDVEGEIFYGYRFYPHKVKGEGFFITCLQKEGEVISNQKIKIPKKSRKIEFLPKKYLKYFEKWIKNMGDFEFILNGDQVSIFPKSNIHDFRLLSHFLSLKLIGIDIGKFKNDKFQPSHHLAISSVLHENITSINLNYDQAIDYLKRKDFELELQNLKGWVLLKYQDQALGWIKALPNRFNNYYPMEWRLRKNF